MSSQTAKSKIQNSKDGVKNAKTTRNKAKTTQPSKVTKNAPRAKNNKSFTVAKPAKKAQSVSIVKELNAVYPPKRVSPVKPGKIPKNVINLNMAGGATVKEASHIKVRYNTTSKINWDLEKELYLVSYLELLVKSMRLSDWSIIVELSDKDKNVFATIESQPDQRRAILTITSNFLQLDADDQKQTLVHELIHCHLFALHYQAEEAFKIYSTSKAQEVFALMLESEIEKATDALADAIAPLLPFFELPR